MPAFKTNPKGNLREGDAVLFFNFRTDRPRQLTQVLTQQDMSEEKMHTVPLHFATMTSYNESFKGLHVIFEKDSINNTIGQVVSDAGRSQIRMAETEKYPHVTFFFSGGREAPFEGENRILVNSPKVASYDLQPEMSGLELTDKALDALHDQMPDFLCLNYANPDMVGHTGIEAAAIKAIETVDSCLQRLVTKALSADYRIIIIADHGNADIIKNEDGSPHTAHTTNLVPIFLVSNQSSYRISDGKLADIAPTLLHLMGIKIPKEMDGDNLLLSNL